MTMTQRGVLWNILEAALSEGVEDWEQEIRNALAEPGIPDKLTRGNAINFCCLQEILRNKEILLNNAEEFAWFWAECNMGKFKWFQKLKPEVWELVRVENKGTRPAYQDSTMFKRYGIGHDSLSEDFKRSVKEYFGIEV